MLSVGGGNWPHPVDGFPVLRQLRVGVPMNPRTQSYRRRPTPTFEPTLCCDAFFFRSRSLLLRVFF